MLVVLPLFNNFTSNTNITTVTTLKAMPKGMTLKFLGDFEGGRGTESQKVICVQSVIRG